MLSWIFAATFVVLPPPKQTGPAPAEPILPPALVADAYPDGVTSEHEYVELLAKQSQEFEREIVSAGPDMAARQRAYLGNWTLTERCEPLLTRLLFEIAEPGDFEALESLSEAALAHLAAARGQWPRDHAERLEDLDLVTEFGRAVSLLARSRLGRPDQPRTERVANELAIWMDDDRREVSDAALLWHSTLHYEIGNTARALKTLPPPLAPISGNITELYLRMLRCSILSDSGSSSLAMALILKMEERLEQWIPDASNRQTALCSLTWFRARIARAHQPAGDGLYKEIWQDWLTRARATLEDEDAPCRLIRLTGCVPLLMSKPEPGSPAAHRVEPTQAERSESDPRPAAKNGSPQQ